MRQKIKKLYEKKVVKDYLSVAITNLILQPINLFKSFFVAKYLGPADYGLLKSVELIQMLNKFGNLGFKAVASREVAHAIGSNNPERADVIRNTNYSAEIILSFVLFFLSCISALFVTSTVTSILIILASVGLLANKVLSIIVCEAGIQKKFILISKNTFYSGILTAIFVICLVPYFEIYAILIVNIVVAIYGHYHLKQYLKFHFEFSINKDELKKSFKIGIPFALGTLAFATYKYSERILVLKYLNKEALGFFSFGMMVSDNLLLIFKAAIKVRMQHIWETVGAGHYKKVHNLVVKETFLTTFISILCIPIFWYLIEYLVPIFLPRWIEGVKIAQMMLFAVPFMVIANYTNSVTDSSTVNKIRYPMYMRLLSTGIAIALTVFFYKRNSLSLEIYVIINIIGYAFYNLSLLVAYKLFFVNKYLR